MAGVAIANLAFIPIDVSANARTLVLDIFAQTEHFLLFTLDEDDERTASHMACRQSSKPHGLCG